MSGFLIDTNVISELVKRQPNKGVTAWISSVDEELLFLSVLTFGEIRKGIHLLPANARRSSLEAWLDRDLNLRFSGRILPVDTAIADRWGRISADAARKGQVLPVVDGLLAATALHHNLTVVTRNTSDIELTPVAALNPWL